MHEQFNPEMFDKAVSLLSCVTIGNYSQRKLGKLGMG